VRIAINKFLSTSPLLAAFRKFWTFSRRARTQSWPND